MPVQPAGLSPPGIVVAAGSGRDNPLAWNAAEERSAKMAASTPKRANPKAIAIPELPCLEAATLKSTRPAGSGDLSHDLDRLLLLRNCCRPPCILRRLSLRPKNGRRTAPLPSLAGILRTETEACSCESTTSECMPCPWSLLIERSSVNAGFSGCSFFEYV